MKLGMLVVPSLSFIVSASNEDRAVGFFSVAQDGQDKRLEEVLDKFNQETTDIEDEYNNAYDGVDINTTLKEVEEKTERRTQILVAAICSQFNCGDKKCIAQIVRDGVHFQIIWTDMSAYAAVEVLS